MTIAFIMLAESAPFHGALVKPAENGVRIFNVEDAASLEKTVEALRTA